MDTLVQDKLSYRTVTIGDSSVGKTSIVNRFIRDRFNPSETNTVGALYDVYTETANGYQIEIQIWDTAGQEQYRALSPVYFRSAAAALLVFDVTNRRSFDSLADWLTLFRSSSSAKALVFVVGNKTDLSDARMVNGQEALDWARQRGLQYFETSAQSGDGVGAPFKAIADALGTRIQDTNAAVSALRQAEPVPAGQGGCC
jgi:small GTP-binding protein